MDALTADATVVWIHMDGFAEQRSVLEVMLVAAVPGVLNTSLVAVPSSCIDSGTDLPVRCGVGAEL